ncbi:MAG: hypothetical protein U0175_37580 [Caldilineaceae bacterium]
MLLIDEAENQLASKVAKALNPDDSGVFSQSSDHCRYPFSVYLFSENAHCFVCKSEIDHCAADESAQYSNRPIDGDFAIPLLEKRSHLTRKSQRCWKTEE